MKLFKIFAVGLILSAVVVTTALAPVGSAASAGSTGGATQYESFSSQFFTLPSFELSNFNIGNLTYTTPEISTTGPTSNPPEADVVPNFSGLIVEGPTAIDADKDGTDDLIVDENGKIFINNRFEVNGDPNDDTNEELDLIGNDSLILGEYSAGVFMIIDNLITQQLQIKAYDSTGVGYFSVLSPNIKFYYPLGDVDMEIEGDLKVDGTIRTGNAVGTNYINRQYASGATSVTATCDTDHIMTGCSGYGASTSFKGVIPSVTSCTAYRGSSGNIYAYAHCFDPSGIKDPDTYYYP
jgi:hypothetical protein